MSANPKPIFLERQTYRRRRLADAARLLPLLGALLMGLPLLWFRPEGEAMRTTHVMMYIFGCWAVLALLSAIVSVRLQPDEDSADPGRDE